MKLKKRKKIKIPLTSPWCEPNAYTAGHHTCNQLKNTPLEQIMELYKPYNIDFIVRDHKNHAMICECICHNSPDQYAT